LKIISLTSKTAKQRKRLTTLTLTNRNPNKKVWYRCIKVTWRLKYIQQGNTMRLSSPLCGSCCGARSLVFCEVFCTTLLVHLFFFICLLCCLSFVDLQLLIDPFSSLNFSCYCFNFECLIWCCFLICYRQTILHQTR